MASELHIVEMTLRAYPKHADKLMLAAVETSLTSIAFDPNNQVQQRIENCFTGLDEFTDVPPIGAYKEDRPPFWRTPPQARETS
jgi:hypothetical protein